MTSAPTSRRALLALLAIISLVLVYLVGVAHAAIPGAAATTGPVNTSLTHPLTGSGVGGTGITVNGSAVVAGTPDTLRLDLAVVASAPSVSEALARANASAAAAQKSLLGSGVVKKDLQTSGLSISPRYANTPGTPRITGYVVSESVTAKLRDLGRAGDAVGKVVAAGGDAVQVNGISLELQDTGALVSTARDQAFADARTKAAQYARAAQRSLGDVLSIDESVAGSSPIMVSGAAMDLAGKPAVPIQPGSRDVGVTVTVVFAMT